MKDAIFKEYGLSAKCFLDKFNQVRIGASDTFVLYGAKLEGIFKQYLQTRGSPGAIIGENMTALGLSVLETLSVLRFVKMALYRKIGAYTRA